MDEGWKLINDNLIAVQISPYLQLTLHGLVLAILKIPRDTRKQFKSFAWAGEKIEAGQRWGLIKVERLS